MAAITPLRHIFYFSFKELQYKYNKKFWNFQIFLLFFAFFCAYSWIRTNALPYPYGRFLCLSGLTDSISNISRHYFDSSVVSCSVYASNLYRQIGNAGRVSTYTFNLCGCVLSRYIFIQPRLLNYNAEISSIMNGCLPPLLYEVLDLILHKPRQFQADSYFQAVVHHTILTAKVSPITCVTRLVFTIYLWTYFVTPVGLEPTTPALTYHYNFRCQYRIFALHIQIVYLFRILRFT